METFFIDGLSNVTYDVLGPGQHVIVSTTGKILIDNRFVLDDGIRDVESISEPSYASIYGEVHASLNGVWLRAANAVVHVGSTGIVSGGTNGVSIGSGSQAVNDGQISGLLAGIMVTLDHVGIHNTGSISGAVGVLGNQAIGDEATDTTFTNFGSVSGITHGIWLANGSVVTNHGSIEAIDHGVTLSTLDGDVARLINSGTITAALAVEGGAGTEIIVNTGTLEGNVSLLDGDDSFDGRGGLVTGTIDLGLGNDTGYGGAGEEHMLGGDGADELHGEGGIDVLDGGEDNDLLDGGTGSDVLVGGLGDDTYVVDELGDVVTEAFDEGSDTVKASASYALANHVENLILTGTAGLSGTGNDLANVITGNSGNNLLDGSTGVDDLRGGLGDDTYIVSNIGDTVTEGVDGGTDTVKAGVDFTLGGNVENLTLTGNAVRGIGNSGANIITGNASDNLLDGGTGADRLIGGDGHDEYVVDHEGDVIVELAGGGSDIVKTWIDFVIADDVEVEHIFLMGTADLNATGNAGYNDIVGNSGNNILDGGTGADDLIGGLGNDIYIVDDEGDLAAESLDEGTDEVRSSVSFFLSNHFENLVLTGAGNTNGDGNDWANILTGNAGDNHLAGGRGNDQIDGGAGHNTAVFSGAKANYTITANTDGSITVKDLRLDQDGTDTLRNIQSAQFSDGTFSITPPPSPTVQGTVQPIDENAAAHSFVASVKSNALAGDVVTYVLETNPGNKFAIDADTGEITLVGTLDYEAAAPGFITEGTGALERKFYLLQVRAIADGGLGIQSAVVPVKVYVNNLNETPTVLSFINDTNEATVVGEVGNGTSVGTLKSSDPDAGDHLVYSFDSTGLGGSSGGGNAGGLFKIEAGVLKFAHAPSSTDAETYTVTIKVTDKNAGDGSKSFYKDFLITFTPGEPVNTAPTIQLQNGGTTNATDRGSAVTPFLNKVLVSDAQADDALDVTIAFARAEGILGGTNNVDGVVSGTTITYTFHGTSAQIKAILDGLTFTPSNHHAAGPDITTNFTITVKDETHAVVSNSAVNVVTDVQGDPPETQIISIVAEDAVHNEGNSGFTDFTFTVSRTDIAGAPTAHWQIVLANGSVVTAEDFDQTTGTVGFAEGIDTATITVKVKGDVVYEGSEVFTVLLSNASAGNAISLTAGSATGTITNDDAAPLVNNAPIDIQLSGPGAAAEYAAAGTLIGTLSASDPDGSDTFSYALLSATDRFDIVGGQLVVKNGFKLDFEQAASHQAVVRVTDQSGASFDKAFTIGVVDVNPEVTAGSADNDVFKGGAANDRLGGGLGNDILWGGLGKDTLTGNAGKDIFVFSTRPNKKTNLDKIVDFNVKDDTIWLDNAVFTKLGRSGSEAKPVKVNKKFFTIGDTAKDANDHLIYNKKKGILYYDVDGIGSKAAIEITTTKKNLKISINDLFVI